MGAAKKKLLIITGGTMSGKTTLSKELSSRFGIDKVRTMTTRPPRDGEVDGVDYDFVSKDYFQELIDSGRLVEFDKNDATGHFYGLSFKSLDKMASLSTLSIVTNPDGYENYTKSLGDDWSIVSIFIDCDPSVVEERVMNSLDFDTDDFEQLESRLSRLKSEESWPERMSLSDIYIVVDKDNSPPDVSSIKENIDHCFANKEVGVNPRVKMSFS